MSCIVHLQVRQVVSDFGVILSIIIMVIIDAATGLDTLKLKVPNQFRVSRRIQCFLDVDKCPFFSYYINCPSEIWNTYRVSFMDSYYVVDSSSHPLNYI